MFLTRLAEAAYEGGIHAPKSEFQWILATL